MFGTPVEVRRSMKNKVVIEFESGRYWIENNIIRVRFIDKLKKAFTIDDVAMHVNAYDKLTNEIGIVPLLIDLRGVNTTISLEVLRYISKRIKALNKSDTEKAYLINSLGVRLLVNFYIKVITTESKSEVFENEAEALRWLDRYQRINDITKTK